jgi:hypothetical protein
MKSFVYGLLFGAAAMYLYMTQGEFVDASVASMLAWRDGAKQSVYGFGGKRQ